MTTYNQNNTIIDYRFIYNIWPKNTKNTNTYYLPFCLVDIIYQFLYSPRHHFNEYIKLNLWKRCWIIYKEKQTDELQVVLEYLFDFWGVTNNHYNIDNLYETDWFMKYCFPGEVIFDVDDCIRFNKHMKHITVSYDNSPTSYFYVMDTDAYNEYCYYDGCERYYWMTDVYETAEFHLIQASFRN